MIKKIILVGLLVTLIRNFRAFTIIFSLTGGGPLRSTELITLFIYKKAFFQNDIAQAATVSIIILIIYSFLSHFTFRIKRRRSFA